MKPTRKKKTFSAMLSELESIADAFEKETLDLDEALMQFERGLQLAETLKTHLTGVEQKIERLKKRFRALDEEHAAGTADSDEP